MRPVTEKELKERAKALIGAPVLVDFKGRKVGEVTATKVGMRVTVDIPEEIFKQIEKERRDNAEADHPEQAAKSKTIESFILYLVEVGLGEM